MEKKELQRYIDWIVEEILMNPNQRSRQDIELMERGEFGNRTVTLVTNLINELVDKAREEGREEIRQLLRDKIQVQEFLKENPKFYKGKKIETAGIATLTKF